MNLPTISLDAQRRGGLMSRASKRHEYQAKGHVSYRDRSVGHREAPAETIAEACASVDAEMRATRTCRGCKLDARVCARCAVRSERA